MPTEVPQRELRNSTAAVLRRVEAGEEIRITVHGRPVADLVPIKRRRTFIPLEELHREMGGLLSPDDNLAEELKQWDDEGRDPFE